jgi:hypothetical protein
MVILLTEIMQLSIIQGCFYSTLDAGDWPPGRRPVRANWSPRQQNGGIGEQDFPATGNFCLVTAVPGCLQILKNL